MSEVNVQIQNPKQTVNINNPVITIEMPTDSISVEIVEGQPIEIQVQNPVIEVNIGGPCDCSGGGHEIQDEGTPLAQRAKLNFIGPGVTATDNPGQGATDVIIPGGGGGTWGSITGTLSDQTDLQTALDGKSDTGHTHALSDITQSGATTNQVPKWDGSAWVPANEAGGGASVTQITYSDMQTAITNGTLTPGGWYLITDASGTDLGFLTNAVTENTINVSGVGGYLNADFQAVGDYSGTPETFNAQLGIWRTAFEAVTINYLNLPPDEIAYTTSSGLLTDGETFTTDLGRSGTVVTDNGSTVTATGVSGALVAGEIITGDISGNTVTVDSYGHFVFAAGDTITGGTTGATAVVVSDDMVSMTVYMTSAGVAFDGSEVLDNGAGVTANQDGAATSPTIVLGDVVIWNLSHYQLTDATLLDGNNPETNTSAYTLLDKATYPETYVTAWDVSEFDFINQWLQYRADLLGNKVFLCKKTEVDVFDNGITAVSVFQFGKPTTFGNVVSDAFVYIANCIGNFYSNSFQSSSYLTGVNILESCNFQYNDFANNAVLQSSTFSNGAVFGQNVIRQFGFISNLSLNDSSFSNNTLFQNSQVSSFSLGQNGQANNNILENGAQLTGITAGANCSISRNKIGQEATFGGSTTLGDYAEVEDNFISNGGQISGITIGQDGQIKNNYIYSASILDITAGTDFIMSNNILESGASITNISALDEVSVSYNKLSANSSIGYLPLLADTARIQFLSLASDSRINNKSFDTGITITNKTIQFISDDTETYTSNIDGYRSQPGFSDIPGTIDITGLTTLDCTAAWAQYRGIYNLTSSNATENIDTITNPPTLFPFTLRPAAGLVLTITGTAYAGIGAGQIALKNASYTLDGDKGEYIVLEIDPLGTGALIEKQVVNGLI